LVADLCAGGATNNLNHEESPLEWWGLRSNGGAA
jgi:hypothetical protein